MDAILKLWEHHGLLPCANQRRPVYGDASQIFRRSQTIEYINEAMNETYESTQWDIGAQPSIQLMVICDQVASSWSSLS